MLKESRQPLGFKNFLMLREGTINGLNVRKFSMEDLLDAYENAGYELGHGDRGDFQDHQYLGFKNGKHVFNVMALDRDNDNTFYVTKFFVTLGFEGNLQAEPSGQPNFESKNHAAAKAFFNQGT